MLTLLAQIPVRITPCKAIEFCLLNTRSIKNKATILNDFVIKENNRYHGCLSVCFEGKMWFRRCSAV